VTDSEKLDLLLKEVQELKKTVNAKVVPAVNRIDKQISIISNMVLAPSEVHKVKKAK